jgi:S1-C subfamily serine protease
LAGAAAGFFTGAMNFQTSFYSRTNATTTKAALTSTTTFALVPVERRAAAALVPPAFLTRRASPVASLYRKPKGTGLEERLLGDDRLLGQALALTSDGWFVTSYSVLEGVRLADVVLWHGGTTYVIERGMTDRLNGTVYLKTSASELTPTAFAHLGGLVEGAEIWIEARPMELAPSIILQDGARQPDDAVVSSETAARRLEIQSASRAGDAGGAVWDPAGSLIGLMESETEQKPLLIPATTIANSFASLLSSNEIRHAYLGVNALDLASSRFDGVRGDLPPKGALLIDNKKTGKPAVLKDSPAGKAKLKAGDVIFRIERDIIDGTADLGEILADYRPGTSVTLGVLRNAVNVDIPVVLGTVVTSEPIK